MDLAQYIDNITFLIDPKDVYVPCVVDPCCQNDIDMNITTLPIENDISKELLFDATVNVPRMGSFAIGAILNYAVKLMPPDQAYVNIGVWAGYSLFCGMIGNDQKKCIGVDNFSEFTTVGPKEFFYNYYNRIKNDNHLFYELDYKEYLNKIHKGVIGVYFYDGSHYEEDQFDGLRLAERFFADDCIIIIDDYNGLPVQNGTNQFLKMSAYNYRFISEQFTCNGCHPTYWNGFAVLQRCDKQR